MHARKGIGLKVIVALGTALLVGQGCASTQPSPSATITPFITMPPAIVTKEPTPLPTRVIPPTPTELPANFLHRKIVYFIGPWSYSPMQVWAVDPVGQQTIQLTSDIDGAEQIRLPEGLPWRIGVVTRTLAPQLTHEALFRFSPPEGWGRCVLCVLSPSGRWLAYAPQDDGLFVVDLTNGQAEEVNKSGYGVQVDQGWWLSSGLGFWYSVNLVEARGYHVFDPVTRQDQWVDLVPGGWNVGETRVAGVEYDPRSIGLGPNNVLVYELDRGRTYSAATSADESLPVWAPDGRHVFYMRRTITPSKLAGSLEECPVFHQPPEWVVAGPEEIWWMDSDTGQTSLVLRSSQFNYMVLQVIENTVVVERTPYEPTPFEETCGPNDLTEGDLLALDLNTLQLEPYIPGTPDELSPIRPPAQPAPVTLFEDSYGSYRVELRQYAAYGASGGRILAAPARQDTDVDSCETNEGSLWKVWQDGRELQLVESGCLFTYLP